VLASKRFGCVSSVQSENGPQIFVALIRFSGGESIIFLNAPRDHEHAAQMNGATIVPQKISIEERT
jgi:hypothetical protein